AARMRARPRTHIFLPHLRQQVEGDGGARSSRATTEGAFNAGESHPPCAERTSPLWRGRNREAISGEGRSSTAAPHPKNLFAYAPIFFHLSTRERWNHPGLLSWK